MVRLRLFLLFLSSCAVVSGLDQLSIDAGGADAAVDQGVADASADSLGDVTITTPPDGIPCGNAICVDQKMCCGTNMGGGNFSFACTTTCDGGIRLTCDDPTECSGLVCCLVSDIASSCAAQCTTAVLCSGPGQCPQNMNCVPYDGGLMHQV